MFGFWHILRIRGERRFACVAMGCGNLSRAIMTATLAAIAIAGWSAQLASADTFVWAGTCGTTDWWGQCYEGPCGDQGNHAFYCNNWGRCDCTDDPQFDAIVVCPGPDDDALLGTSTVTAWYAYVNSLQSSGAFSVEELSVGGGGATIGGTLVVGNYGYGLASFSGPLTTTGTTTIGGTMGGGTIRLDNGVLWENSGAVYGSQDILPLGNGPGTFHNTENGIFEWTYGYVDALFMNEGTVNAQSCEFGQPFTSSGAVNFDGDLEFDMGADFRGGTLNGDGQIFGGVSNSGATLAPGTPESPIDTLFIWGDYTQGPGGTLAIDIGGEGSCDMLNVYSYERYEHGTATLDGTLLINLVDGFTPPPGLSYFFVLTCYNRLGTFADVILPADVPGAVLYSTEDVIVVLSSLTGACCHSPGDCADTLGADCTGVWFGAGTACSDNVCPAACCFADATCQDLGETACYESDGSFEGEGTLCDTFSCAEHLVVACCYADGSCETVPYSDCAGSVIGFAAGCMSGLCTPPRACCHADGSCEDIQYFQCTGYVWFPDFTCSMGVCSPGACCYDDGYCEDVSLAQCTGSAWFGGGASCSMDYCLPAACCYEDGRCEDLSFLECAGGWLGPDTTCSTDPCAGLGACCYPSGCADTLFTDCTGEYARWLGAGASCSTNPCVGPGACCLPDMSCSDGLWASGCAAEGGTFQGAGIPCMAVQCQHGPPTAARGDLNCDGAVNVFDIDPFVLAIASAPDFTAYYAAYPYCDAMLGDVNCDGAVNVFDIDPFVLCIADSGCPPCP